MRAASLISRQQGRLRLLLVLAAIGFLAIFFPNQIERWMDLSPGAAHLAALLLCVLTFTLAILLLRCPSCGKSLFWHAVSKHSLGQWLGWLLDARECPACGYRLEQHTNTSPSK